MTSSSEKMILKELRAIHRELEYIKSHMVDADVLLTPDEEAQLERALDEHRRGKTKSLADFKRGLRGA